MYKTQKSLWPSRRDTAGAQILESREMKKHKRSNLEMKKKLVMYKHCVHENKDKTPIKQKLTSLM